LEFKLETANLKGFLSDSANHAHAVLTFDQIERLIGLVRKGNSASLAQARNLLGIELNALALRLGVIANTLNDWETKREVPSQKDLITWRIKLGADIEGEIASFLRTNDPELIHQFWEIMWRLNDL
jgi:DNA-binding transcriptional regulator YiaG